MSMGATDGRVAVVGSGPAALATVWHLIARGIRPLVLDVGDTPPAQTVRLVEELRSTFGRWRPQAVRQATSNPTIVGKALPKKLVFGSDYFHGKDRAHSPLLNESFVEPTFAMGGYTVAWGGAMLPIRDADMGAWPIGAEDLAEGFSEVLRRIPFSGDDDGLSAHFPLHGAIPQPLALSEQAQRVRRRLTRLDGARMVSGQARLAVKAQDCRYCGMCLSGCPFGVIQTFDAYFRQLIAQDLIDYRAGVIVTRLAETAGAVELHAADRDGRPLTPMRLSKVFLGAGAIASTRIVLESMQLYDQGVAMLDSQKFAVPLLVPDREMSELRSLNTLPSLFVDMRLDSAGPQWAHLQVSSFSDYAQQALDQRLRLGPLRLAPMAGALTRRLMVGWGGLHSDHSDGFTLTLLRAHAKGRPILKIRPHVTRATRTGVRLAIAEMARKLRPASVWMLTPAAVLGPPGAGFHFGGSLGMRREPASPLHTDSLGRLPLGKHIHVVDSSVFSSIPATTMVMTLMANAWRIAGKALS